MMVIDAAERVLMMKRKPSSRISHRAGRNYEAQEADGLAAAYVNLLTHNDAYLEEVSQLYKDLQAEMQASGQRALYGSDAFMIDRLMHTLNNVFPSLKNAPHRYVKDVDEGRLQSGDAAYLQHAREKLTQDRAAIQAMLRELQQMR
ncbi:hypothetical protein CBS101457_000034 [Exobasidium rhododendri]|nr:hypothetical protein CBS101457_000034 [Exobasidium rhododendri]